MTQVSFQAEKVQVPGSFDEVNELFHKKGWSDGLPIMPPTEERVSRMLTGTARKPEEVLGFVPPVWGTATVKMVAINAVMAGCIPQYMPVIVAVVEALLEDGAKSSNDTGGLPNLGLLSRQTTTNPAVPLVIVNGPVRDELGFNYGTNLYGEGNRANATVGRALRLILRNVGGARPPDYSATSQGRTERFTFCFAENEEENPWQPLHVEKGFGRRSSTVTVAWGTSPVGVNDSVGTSAAHIMTIVADASANMGMTIPTSLLFVVSPEHATIIARDGWTKEDVKLFLYNNARLPMSKAKETGRVGTQEWPKWWHSTNPDSMVSIITDRKDVDVVVAGGPGKYSSLIPGAGRGNTVEIKP